MKAALRRPAGAGWLVLIGGGEFSFEETEAADRAWLAKLPARESDGNGDGDGDGDGDAIAFLPTASGSTDYGDHFAVYLDEYFERRVVTVPVFRPRDARRGKNAERIGACAGAYLGGGVADTLIETLRATPCEEALLAKLTGGGAVVAIAAAAQALGAVVRGLRGGTLEGLGWLEGGALETNFEPGHDRRLRQLLGDSRARWGLGLPAGSALLLGPDGAVETVGPSYRLDAPDGELIPLEVTSPL